MKKINLLLIVLLLFTAGCGNSGNHEAGESPETATIPEVVANSTVIRDGEEIPLPAVTAGYKKNLFVLWQPSCGPCEEEWKVLNTIIDDLEEEGIQVIAVAFGEDPEEIKAAEERWPVRGQNVLGTESFLTSVSPPITGTPAMFFTDEAGIPFGDWQKGYDGEDSATLKDRILESGEK